MAKAALRQAKNITKGFTDIQIKVREATSNDPWGPSGSQMAEIAADTFDGYFHARYGRWLTFLSYILPLITRDSSFYLEARTLPRLWT